MPLGFPQAPAYQSDKYRPPECPRVNCAFTQTKWDEKGYAIRDPDSTTYVGAIETAAEFGKRIYLEAWNRVARGEDAWLTLSDDKDTTPAQF
jgi:hypothetical protein